MRVVGKQAPRSIILWGSELSPFALKLQALLAYAQLPYRWLPRQGRRWECWRVAWQIERAKRRREVRRYPAPSALDEYPLVPYLLVDREVHYDTSALAQWIDAMHPVPGAPLLPAAPLLRFTAQLIDEAFDELGLYLVHHNRWVLSATTNRAGQRLGREFRRVVLPGFAPIMGRRFARRQVRRLPYLFSVAPVGFSLPGWPARLTPPARAGFPPTQALLDGIWRRALAALEGALRHQPFLLGKRFSVADASVYGQLAMNLSDPTAAQAMRQLAPHTHAWLCSLHHATAPAGATSGNTGGPAFPPIEPCDLQQRGELHLPETLYPLLELIAETFVPLMRQNAAAYEAARSRGEGRFNEAAFEAGRALYDGELCGQAFRSVAKTFQVRVWGDLRRSWRDVPQADRAKLAQIVPGLSSGMSDGEPGEVLNRLPGSRSAAAASPK